MRKGETGKEGGLMEMESVFRALLDWDLRLSIRDGSAGKLYSVWEDLEDGKRREIMTDASTDALVAWVQERRAWEHLDAAFQLLNGVKKPWRRRQGLEDSQGGAVHPSIRKAARKTV